MLYTSYDATAAAFFLIFFAYFLLFAFFFASLNDLLRRMLFVPPLRRAGRPARQKDRSTCKVRKNRFSLHESNGETVLDGFRGGVGFLQFLRHSFHVGSQLAGIALNLLVTSM